MDACIAQFRNKYQILVVGPFEVCTDFKQTHYPDTRVQSRY